MINLRLSWYNGTRWSGLATLASLGYAQPKMYLRSRAAATFTLVKAGGDPAGAADIPFEAPVRIYGTLAGMNGGAEGIIFQGRRIQNNGRAHPEAANVDMLFADPWYDLEHITFQHHWYEGFSRTLKYSSRLFLFQDISAGPTNPYAFLTADLQLKEICDFAQTQCGANLVFGAADPAWQLPPYPVKAITCAEAINIVLRSIPDAITYFDYTTSPPTLYFRQRMTVVSGSLVVNPNLSAVTLPYAGSDGNGRYHKSSEIKSREDLQIPAVVIQYQENNTTNGITTSAFITDAWPGGATGLGLRDLVVPIDLRGGILNTITQPVTATAIDPTTTGFWTAMKPDLADGSIVFDATTPIVDTTINGGGGHPDGITIVDGAGNPVSLTTYPNMLGPGLSTAPWMQDGSGTPIVTKEVTISAKLKYKKSVSAFNMQVMDKHPVSARVKLTNAPAGTTTYSTITNETAAEPVPTGLAKFIYQSCQTLQYEGAHVIVEANTYQIIGPQNLLNISGGATAWSAMNMAIYDTEIDFFHGRTTVNFGPHKNVTAAQMYELLTMWSWRRVYDNPNLRNNGQDTTGLAAQLGKDAQKENTNHGLPDQSQIAAYAPPDGSGHVAMAALDANGQQILFQTIDNTGAVVTSQPQVDLKQADLGASGGTGRVAKWRTMSYTDPITGASTCKFAGEKDITVGGGGSGATKYDLVGPMFKDYFVVKDGAGNLWPIAKPPELQNQVAHTWIEGVEITYNYVTAADGATAFSGALLYVRRAAGNGTITANEGITPPYIIENLTLSPAQPGSAIYADTPAGGTGAVIQSGDTTLYGPGGGATMTAGTAVTLMDTNRSGRAWSVLANQTGEGS